MPTLLRELDRSLRALLALTVVCGLAYPLVVLGIGQVAFRDEADGSLLRHDGRVVGSRLIAQGFEGPRWFLPRPSAADYDASASAGSNLGPNSTVLADEVRKRIASWRDLGGRVPTDLVTASGSGLDPDISPAAARFQIPRVTRARGLDETAVRRLVDDHVDSPALGFLGRDRVNVLELNLALQALR